MSEEKKELFAPFELEGAFVMVSGLQRGKILEIAPEIREKVQEKGLGFPLTEMVGAYFTSKQIKAYSKSEIKKMELRKLEKTIKSKAGIKDAIKKTKKIEEKVVAKKSTAKKTSKKTANTKKELVKEERKETNAALSWFTQVLADSIGGIQ